MGKIEKEDGEAREGGQEEEKVTERRTLCGSHAVDTGQDREGPPCDHCHWSHLYGNVTPQQHGQHDQGIPHILAKAITHIEFRSHPHNTILRHTSHGHPIPTATPPPPPLASPR